MGVYFTLDTVSTGGLCPKCIFFPEIIMIMINW